MSRKHAKPLPKVRLAGGPEPVGQWAVFRESSSKNATFSCMHETRDAALAEAKRLASLCIEQYGHKTGRALLYVVFIDAKVGLADGKLHDGGQTLIQSIKAQKND